MDNAYKITEDFQVGDTDFRALVLDRKYDLSVPIQRGVAVIDGKEYPFHLQSTLRWVTVKSHDSFQGKTVQFC